MTNPSWPSEVETGLIPTDNAMGVMTAEPSPAAEEFIAWARMARRPLLEVGAAYGNATLPALAEGATVIANDLSASELSVLASAAPPEHAKRLVLVPARFPHEVKLAEGSLSGVLAAQVLHFLDGGQIERAFSDVYRWLEPKGRFFIVVMTPSLSYYSKLRPAYAERSAAGERWPGIFDPRPVATPDWRDRLPSMVHLFEKNILSRCAREAGFSIESMEYFCFRNFPEKHRTDGKEYITATLEKRVQH